MSEAPPRVEEPKVRYRNLVYDNFRWTGFEFRPGDIVISTPPKAGTTLTQMICALLILQSPDLGGPIDDVSPWLDMQTRSVEAVFAALAAQRHRRVIKTHTPRDGLPYDERVTYICVARDPRDMALSWDNHVANMNLEAFFAARARAVGTADLAELMTDPPPTPPAAQIDRFWAYMDAPGGSGARPTSLAATMAHLASFWAIRDAPNVVLLHYADLTADLEGQMRGLAARLGIDVPEDLWPTLVAAAGFEEMRRRAAVLAPSSTMWRDKERFFHRGTSGQWQGLLDEQGRRRYAQRVAGLADPDLLAWVHRGEIG